jgi:hypothetical protein
MPLFQGRLLSDHDVPDIKMKHDQKKPLENNREKGTRAGVQCLILVFSIEKSICKID